MNKQEIKETWALWKIRATIYCVFALIHCRKWASNLACLEPWLLRVQERLEDTLPKPPPPPIPTRGPGGQIGNKNALPFPTNMGTELLVQSVRSEALGRAQLVEAYKGNVFSVPGLVKGKKPFLMAADTFFQELPDMIEVGSAEFMPSKEFQKRMKARKVKTAVLVKKFLVEKAKRK